MIMLMLTKSAAPTFAPLDDWLRHPFLYYRRRHGEGKEVMDAATALDADVPRWHNRVDPDLLNLQSCHFCVLGQMWGCGGWSDHAGRLISTYQINRYVFSVPSYEKHWKREIALRSVV